MIAGDHEGRSGECFQPAGGLGEFVRCSEIGQIPAHKDHVHACASDILHQCSAGLSEMDVLAVLLPGQKTQGALVERRPPVNGRRRQMRV